MLFGGPLFDQYGAVVGFYLSDLNRELSLTLVLFKVPCPFRIGIRFLCLYDKSLQILLAVHACTRSSRGNIHGYDYGALYGSDWSLLQQKPRSRHGICNCWVIPWRGYVPHRLGQNALQPYFVFRMVSSNMRVHHARTYRSGLYCHPCSAASTERKVLPSIRFQRVRVSASPIISVYTENHMSF
jgi:hypothetical protein